MNKFEIVEKLMAYVKIDDRKGLIKFFDELNEDELKELSSFLLTLIKMCESRLFLKSLPNFFD